MKQIAIYGAGGLGREVASVLEQLFPEKEPRDLIGFFDDGITIGTEVSHFGKVLGGIDELNSWPTPLEVALCFGDGKTAKKVYEKITNSKISFPNLISRDFLIADIETFQLGMGNIVKGGCCVTTNITIGNFNLLNGGIVIGHDATIGSFNTFMPGCKISGEVSIGNECMMGSMSFVKQQIKIGDRVRLSPLSALLTKPKDNGLYIGNPAKRFKY